MATIWTKSTGKHHVPRAEALHAMLNAVYYEQQFDAPRIPGSLAPSLIIGPGTDGAPIEVMFEEKTDGDVIVFHVMPARRKHLARLERTSDALAA